LRKGSRIKGKFSSKGRPFIFNLGKPTSEDLYAAKEFAKGMTRLAKMRVGVPWNERVEEVRERYETVQEQVNRLFQDGIPSSC